MSNLSRCDTPVTWDGTDDGRTVSVTPCVTPPVTVPRPDQTRPEYLSHRFESSDGWSVVKGGGTSFHPSNGYLPGPFANGWMKNQDEKPQISGGGLT